MASQIAWLDSTPEEQRAARELIRLFSDQEGRDELGIGQVRDAFSDLLFPGTSILQTRARYFVFIPWCYAKAATGGFKGDRLSKRANDNERHLIKTLIDAKLDDSVGLIGGRAGPQVKNLPSTAYWSGLRRFNILAHDGELGVLRASTTDDATELSERGVFDWDPGLPQPPADFPNIDPGGFTMTRDEAEWLTGRMISANPSSALAFLLNRRTHIDSAVDRPWHPDAVPRKDFEALEHAYWFSKVMNGAALLYNLLVGEKYDKNPALDRYDDVAGTYRGYLDAWTSDFLVSEKVGLAAWDTDRMWELALSVNPRISPVTQKFVDDWVAGVRGRTGPVADDPGLRALVENRESRKGKQSRLLNEKMLHNWSGAAGTSELAYRWGTVRTLVNDIVDGLNANARP